MFTNSHATIEGLGIGNDFPVTAELYSTKFSG